jgi:oligosaccharyltransferase complex subunit alpha (ribophorin I)
LVKPLAPGSSIKLRLRIYLTHQLTPFPAQIAQGESHLVVYSDSFSSLTSSPWFLSTYETASGQSTEIKLPSGASVESYTESFKPVKKDGNSISYGPSTSSVAGFSTPSSSPSPLRVHFTFNAPLLTVSTLERILELSLWGNLAVEEYYTLKNDAAALKGSFSRLDYMRSNNNAPGVFRSLNARIPIEATDIYFRDRIGNISTSTVNPKRQDKVTELELIPRFPLFGSWQTAFHFGYNIPIVPPKNSSTDHTFLSTDASDSSRFILAASFGCPVEIATVDEMTLRVILPEGATQIDFSAPFAVESVSMEVQKSYLDTAGKPVLVIKKKNVIDEHNQIFYVTFSMSASGVYGKFVVSICGFAVLLGILLVGYRFSLKITKDEVVGKQKKNN